MIPGYNTSQLFREDTLLIIMHLYDEIAALQKIIERVEKEVAASEERIKTLKQEFGPSV